MQRIALISVFILGIAGAAASGSEFRLAPLFGDNMVLQQASLVTVWGWGVPGQPVALSASWGGHAEGTIGANGAWNVKLKTPRAGGPFVIEVRSGGSSVLYMNNVMTGEVWLCSGQSNMEMPLSGWPPSDTIQNSGFEVRNSANCAIRFFTVTRQTSAVPESTCIGQWVESSPVIAPGFSATAYFFAKSLQQALHVPVGMIHSSWGGTPVEAWMSTETIAKVPEFDTTMQKLAASKESRVRVDRWLEQFPTVEIRKDDPANRWKDLHFNDDSCSRIAYDETGWHVMRLPVYWESTELGDIVGAVWFRKHLRIPSSWVGKDLVVELGPVDDMDVTFVNGKRVGGIETEGAYKVPRVYSVPAAAVTDSNLCVAVRVLDYQGGGGIWGNREPMNVHPAGVADSIPLSGDWKYLPVAELYGGKLHVFGAKGEKFFTRPSLPIGIGPSTPTTLFNGMIAPLVPFTIKGAIWYQGESNVGNPMLYERLFPMMISNWRDAFASPSLPFYYVQIAPYEYGVRDRSQLLREAQLKTLALKNTGMAVTLDIGNPKNIHPANKPAVGERLARWALARTYGRTVAYSGPLLSKVRVHSGVVELKFEHAGKGLVVEDANGQNGFQIAGPDSVFRSATVKVSGDRLIVSNPEIPHPLAVRYAFTHAPAATLFNKDGLPATSFRTDDWQK